MPAPSDQPEIAQRKGLPSWWVLIAVMAAMIVVPWIIAAYVLLAR